MDGILKAYSGHLINEEQLRSSSSGGAAATLEKTIVKRNGIVFGAIYSKDYYQVEYSFSNSIDDLQKFNGSKYISAIKQVEMSGKKSSVFDLVCQNLVAGKRVLFTGLPCDIAAIKTVVKIKAIDSSRLYTVDLICHGPTFSEVHKQFIEGLERQYRSKLAFFSVRHKEQKWNADPLLKAVFFSGKEVCVPYFDTDYGKAFSIAVKDGCYSCSFKGNKHVSDITIGDYWGIEENNPSYNPLGVSVLLVHSQKGMKLVNWIDQNEFVINEENNTEKIIANNLMYENCRKKKDTDFLLNLTREGLHEAVLAYERKALERG